MRPRSFSCFSIVVLIAYTSSATAQQYCASGAVTSADPGSTFNAGDQISMTMIPVPGTLSCTTTAVGTLGNFTNCTSQIVWYATSGNRNWTSDVPPSYIGGVSAVLSASGSDIPGFGINSGSSFEFIADGGLVPEPPSPSTNPSTAASMRFAFSYPGNLLAGGVLPTTIPTPADIQAAEAAGIAAAMAARSPLTAAFL